MAKFGIGEPCLRPAMHALRLDSQSSSLPQPELVERLVVVDISPVNTTSSSDFPAYMAAMKATNIPEKVPRSFARNLADEQLSSLIQVIPSSPWIVWVGTSQETSGSPSLTGNPLPPTAPPIGQGCAELPAHQPGGGRRALCVESELGCLGPACEGDHGLPTTTRILPWAYPLPPRWKL